MFRIWICKFLGLPDSDPFVGVTDPAPDQATIVRKTLLLQFFDFLFLRKNVNVPSEGKKPEKVGKKILFVGV